METVSVSPVTRPVRRVSYLIANFGLWISDFRLGILVRNVEIKWNRFAIDNSQFETIRNLLGS